MDLEEMEGEDGRGPTLKNMGELMPAVKSRCWRQNLKVVAQRTQTLLQDEEQWSCKCAHPERGEAEEKERQRRR
jgi:organic hydroperoxide reductase OsmC/OhrA